MQRLHIYISGRVQGVCFRARTQAQAKSLCLTGWVRNLTDGRVEVLAEGSAEILEQLLAWCQQGPPSAEVTNIEIDWTPATQEFTRFQITSTI